MLAKQLQAVVLNDLTLARDGIADFLVRERGIEVTGTSANRTDGLKLVDELQPDILITEVLLGADLCLELIQWVRKTYPTVKVLVVSRKSERVFAERSLRNGAHGFVSLRGSMEEIDQALTTVLEGDVYLSPHSRSQVLGRLVGKQEAIKRGRLEVLTRRELEVFVRTGRGYPPREIAAELDLSVKTIETYRDKIKDKLGLRNSLEVLKYAMECVLFDFKNTESQQLG